MIVFVGNLHWETTEQQIEALLAHKDIEVDSVRIVHDRTTGESKGFGFISCDEANGKALLKQTRRWMLGGREMTFERKTEREPGRKKVFAGARD